jgi:hypothetical protein
MPQMDTKHHSEISDMTSKWKEKKIHANEKQKGIHIRKTELKRRNDITEKNGGEKTI